MAKVEQFSRLIHHGISTSGLSFTTPTSNDHTDETWLATDLYIGEMGINLSDDTAFIRTNNGIVQLATATSSGTSSTIFVFNTPDIQISSSISADTVSPSGTYNTDLGSTSLRWKNLYLGGSTSSVSLIDVNAGLHLKESSDSILTTNNISSNNSPIEIGLTSSSVVKDRPLYLNGYNNTATGTTNYITTLSTGTVSFSNNSYVVAAGGSNITFSDGVSNVVHLGQSKGRSNYDSNEVVTGGTLAIRGIEDDGTTQYIKSDWKTTQSKLRTSNALTTNIVTIPWNATASGGDVLQVKSYIVGVDINDASLVYSAEVMGAYSIGGTASSLETYEIGTPIINAQSSFVGTQPDCEMSVDGDGVYIKVTGVSTNTIQWLCSYSYHRLINIF